MIRKRSLAATLVGASVIAAQPVSAQATTAHTFAAVALSPDGHHLAWIGPASREGNERPAGVVVADQRSSWSPTAVALPGADAGSAAEVTWSHDGRALAILATTGHGAPTLYVWTSDHAPIRRLLVSTGAIHDVQWSPDGAHLAVLYSSAAEEANSPVAATPRDTGVMDTHVDRQHLAIVNVATGAITQASPADLYIYEFDWSPNGKRIVVSEARGSGNNNWWVARLAGDRPRHRNGS